MSEAPACCWRCGARLASEARFCIACGSEIAPTPAPVTPPYVPVPDAPATKPPGGFPWGVCAVVAGVVVVLFVLAAVVLVARFVFRHPPTSATPERVRQATGESPKPAAVSAEEAVARVRARPEVSAFLQTGQTPGTTPRVELDGEDDEGYVVHVYQQLTQAPQAAPAAIDFGWYRASKATGDVMPIPRPWAVGALPPPRQ